MRLIHLIMLLGYLHCAHHDAVWHGAALGHEDAAGDHSHCHATGSPHADGHDSDGPGDLCGNGKHDHAGGHLHQCLCAPLAETLGKSFAAQALAVADSTRPEIQLPGSMRDLRDGPAIHRRTKLRPLYLHHHALII